jgi:putative endonuclease
MYYVYLLHSAEAREFYVGFTEDFIKRVKAHNAGEVTSTKLKRPWKIIYLEGYLNKQDALGREKFLKSGSGKKYLRKQLKNYFEP